MMQHLDPRIEDVPEQAVLEGPQTLLSWLPALLRHPEENER